jgi:hypothetical protein
MITILWDASHIWGYLLLHAVRSTGIPFRVLKGLDIAQSGLSGKMLIVPGGSARLKAEALGPQGMQVIRHFVEQGGYYLGFCGGAGLALSSGLNLCSWIRDGMADRLQHLISGHLVCEITAQSNLIPSDFAHKHILLPVWWPGRFDEPTLPHEVEVLARYRAAGPDLYVADMPFAAMPSDILSEWKSMYGVTLRPSLLDGRPCAIAGEHGKGQWLLSYSHLETPELSPIIPQDKSSTQVIDNYGYAGRWFLHILHEWCGVAPQCSALPMLSPASIPILWEDAALLNAHHELCSLIELAENLSLIFPRTPWLFGWRSGVPGAQLNSLYIALTMTLGTHPQNHQIILWKNQKENFMQSFSLFAQGARSWLLARRLSDTLADSAPGMLPRKLLVDQRCALFGSPMFGGGLSEHLLAVLESLI